MMYWILKSLTYIWFDTVMRVFCTPRITGVSHVYSISGPLIIAANHDGRIDPIWIFYAIIKHSHNSSLDIRFTAWYTFMNMPVLGWYLRTMRSFSINKGMGLEILDPAVDFIQKEQGIVGIFPEGKIRKLTEKDKQAKRGVGYLIQQTSAPVLPVYIKYKKRWKYLPLYTVDIRIGEVISYDDIIDKDIQYISNNVLEKIYQLA